MRGVGDLFVVEQLVEDELHLALGGDGREMSLERAASVAHRFASVDLGNTLSCQSYDKSISIFVYVYKIRVVKLVLQIAAHCLGNATMTNRRDVMIITSMLKSCRDKGRRMLLTNDICVIPSFFQMKKIGYFYLPLERWICLFC